MTASKRRRVGSMSVHALQAQAAPAPDLAPPRKPLRDYLAGPRRGDLAGARGLDATAEKPVA